MEGWIMPDIRTSALGGVPFGTSETRPSNPAIGQTYYNGTLGVQEIYTPAGWLPATGANDFNVTLNGTVTTATFTKEYFAGAYTINSALLDSTYDIYVYSTNGTQVGYTKSPSLNATGNFNKIVIVGGTNGDLLSFSYKTTFLATSTTSEITAAPFLSSVSPTALVSIDDSATITGGNFASDVVLKIVDGSGNEINPKSYTRVTAATISFVRPDSFAPGTYSLKVTNPGVTSPTGSNLHILSNCITAGSSPIWQTAATLPEVGKGIAYSTTLVGSDTESTDIDYQIVSGTLPAGLSLVEETGVISGTYTGSDFNTSNVVIKAVDSGGNFVNRTFTIFQSTPAWVTTSLNTPIPGEAYSYQLSSTDNSSITYSVFSGTIVPGLSLSSSGLISGTPSGSAGTSYTFVVRATDAVGNFADRSFTTITGGYIPLSFTPYYAGGAGSTSNVTITNNNTTSVNIFKTSGTIGWNIGAYGQEIAPPLTIEFNKSGPSSDDQTSYTMAGGIPSEMLSTMVTNVGSSYLHGYVWYPVATNGEASIYERSWTDPKVSVEGTPGGNWTSGNLFRISFYPDGRVKYYNVSQSSTPRREVDHDNFTTIRPHVSLYAVNATNGGVSNYKVYLGKVWNGSAFVNP
jgi:hypothetical protein